MKVGFVGRYPPTHCGVAEYTRMLASFLLSVTPDVSIYSLSTDESFTEPYIERESGVRIFPCFHHRGTDFRECLNVLSNLEGVDILHIQHEYGIFGDTDEVLRFSHLAKKEGLTKRVIITLHTVYHPYSGRKGALKFQEKLDEFVDLTIVHSRLQEFELYAQGLNPRKIVRIPHGTLLNPYLWMPQNRLLHNLGVAEGLRRPLLVLPGFIRKDKGINVLVDALHHLNNKPSLLVAGEVKNPELTEVLHESGITCIPRYLSSDEILKAVAAADTIVLPYKDRPGTYSVSGILHLSMGALKPIVGTRVPRLVELYEVSRQLTAVPEDADDLAEKIEWVLNHYDFAVVYASSLYSYAVRVQWARMARRHLINYRKLVKTYTHDLP